MIRPITFALIFAFTTMAIAAEETKFSGPQKGEAIPGFEANGVRGEFAGGKFDPIEIADGKPVLLIFIHELTRPGFGLAKTISQHAVKQKDAKLTTAVIFLSDDPVATTEWAKKVSRYFDEKVLLGVSVDGKEGPGSYGLNRNVNVTALVGKDAKVLENFAIGSPQLQVDGPKILKSIAEVTGGKAPKIEDLVNDRMRKMMREQKSR